MRIIEITTEYYEQVAELWASEQSIAAACKNDTNQRFAIFLGRNPGLSFAAFNGGKIAGAVLCGHDSRGAYLYNLTIAEQYQGKGIAEALAQRVLSKLQLLGICRCHAFIPVEDIPALQFWQEIGFTERTDIKVVSRKIVL